MAYLVRNLKTGKVYVVKFKNKMKKTERLTTDKKAVSKLRLEIQHRMTLKRIEKGIKIRLAFVNNRRAKQGLEPLK